MKGSRNLLIDALRGFSILVVLGAHGLFVIPGSPWWMAGLHKGYYGVIVFFAISGFLITGNTLKRYGEPARINFEEFYTMRVARILPCLVIFVGIMVWAGYYYAPLQVGDKNLLLSAAYHALTLQFNQYYTVANEVPGLGYWVQLWSLSIEEIFYLAFPLVCFFSRKRWVLIVVLVSVALYGLHNRGGYDLFSFWSAADVLAIGCMAAIAVHSLQPWLLRHRWVIRALCLVGFLGMAYIFVGLEMASHLVRTPTFLGLSAAVFLMGASLMEGSVVLRPLAALGRYSYEVYIFHAALISLLTEPALGRIRSLGWSDFATWQVTSAIMLLIVWLLCFVFARLVTEPLNRVIRSFYRRSAPPPAAAVNP